MEIFDATILLIISVAMLSAKTPIKWMITFCFICLMLMDGLNILALEELISEYTLHRGILGTELIAGMVFVLWAYKETGNNRIFCQWMSGMFLISTLFTANYYIGEVSGAQTWKYENFVFVSELVAVVHVTVMLVFSDGIRNRLHTWRNSLSSDSDR